MKDRESFKNRLYIHLKFAISLSAWFAIKS